ncbi:MAG: methyl-accepting chemotaxis protein [Eubacterium sp.]|nr:methyl-accepting chemotaxis protein [Eubacterium sp.]
MVENNVLEKTKVKIRLGGLFKIIFLSSILCMLIPVLVVAVVSTQSVYRDLKSTSDTHLAQLATEKTDQLNAIIDNQLQLVQAVADSPLVTDIVKQKLKDKDTSPDDILMDYLVNIFENSNGKYENFFLSAGNMGIASGIGGADLHDVTGENSYETPMNNETGIYVGTEFSPATGLPVLNVVSTIKDPKTGEPIGVVNDAMSLAAVTSDMMNSFGNDSEYAVYILNNEGLVIASANEEDILNIDFSSMNDSTKAVLTESTESETGTVEFDMGNGELVGAYSTSNGMITLVCVPKSVYINTVQKLVLQIIVIAVVCIVLAIIVITLVSTSIIRPLSRMVMLIERYGNADFSQEVPELLIKRKDEIGILGKSMDKMQKVIRDIFENIIVETDLVAGNVSTSKDEMVELAGRIESVNDLVTDRAAESEETAASTQIISENTLNVKEAVGEITNQANKGMEMSDDINERASGLKSGAEQAQEEVVSLTSQLRDKLSNAVEQSKAVNQIRDLSDAILAIAAETSLLSLNASIEAARAGEAGRGFAVVAEQIGKLADNSQQTVGQIQDITNQVVVAVENLASNSMETITFIDENIIKDYQSMVDTGEQYYDDANRFRELMEGINVSAESLMSNIGAMTASVGEISNANTEGAEGITNISHNTSDMQERSIRVSDIMDSVQDSTVKLKETVHKLTI